MRAEVKEAWVAALRSGKYRQAKGKLVALDENGEKVGYCCLGVLSELAVEAGAPVEYSVYNESVQGTERWYAQFDNSEGMPSENVYNWAGIGKDNVVPNTNREVTPGREFISELTAIEILASRNDFGDSFEEIANVIERCF